MLPRQPRWQYLAPVAAAPVVHWLVTLMRGAPPPHRAFLGAAVVAATVGAVGTRLWLMGDAGYPGRESSSGPRVRIDSAAS